MSDSKSVKSEQVISEDDKVRKSQYASADNLNIRTWFNTKLEKRGGDVFEFVGQLLQGLNLLGQGVIGEIGCGAGSFWDKNLKLIPFIHKAIITDYSDGMVQSCKQKKWYQDDEKAYNHAKYIPSRESILESQGSISTVSKEAIASADQIIAEAKSLAKLINTNKFEIFSMDAAQSDPRFNGPFDCVLALFMLYELRKPFMIHQALKNIASVLRTNTGAAVIMTMDESVHMMELYQMLLDTQIELKKDGTIIDVEFPTSAPAIQAFCAGNAEEYLNTHFKQVKKYKLPSCVLVSHHQEGTDLTGAECIVRYLRSLEFVQRLEQDKKINEHFFTKLKQVAKQRIDDSPDKKLPIRRLDVLYIGRNTIIH